MADVQIILIYANADYCITSALSTPTTTINNINNSK
uniref:Uncharacterized protein n=1 Tax=Anguilla anguilla TaxID=7936 RepID=A0A0E9RA68_ANGAN